MKKVIALCLVLISIVSLCACGEGGKKDVSGTYKNVTFLPDEEYVLNTNSTYESKFHFEKGTYEANSKGGFDLAHANDESVTTFDCLDSYYYRTSNVCAFEEDEEYGLKPTFDENGKSDQWFCAYYDSISDTQWNVIILELKEDGTFKLNDCKRNSSGDQYDENIYEGTYTMEENILKLSHDKGIFPFVFTDEKIYFDVLEKQA